MYETQRPERRRLRRMPAAKLALAWRPRKGLFNRYQPAAGKDFSRNGVSLIDTDNASILEGDSIELRAELSMEAGNLSIDNLIATVRNIRDVENGQQVLGLEFDFSASRTMKSEQTLAQLERIESILTRSENLRQRIQPQDTPEPH
ncbi:hypothetical protein [Marinobacter zhejiangensis]|uniref:PilZ domain-containing protein n=1 Tax=Marinobacter zhejiangensis TaxID=488535 RepID=A0A1I4MF86_9GAMM|nr:hypothetical protein [Marinobacter zhejiangensis]SFM01696.1 hypothetical protein SAMN04487963_1031 [Marinobacter zhejiangensis]